MDKTTTRNGQKTDTETCPLCLASSKCGVHIKACSNKKKKRTGKKYTTWQRGKKEGRNRESTISKMEATNEPQGVLQLFTWP